MAKLVHSWDFVPCWGMAVRRRLTWGALLVGAVFGCGSQGEEGAPREGSGGETTTEGDSSCPAAPEEPEAGATLDGDLIVGSLQDAEAALTISEVGGSLVITRSFPGELYLPHLRRVGHDVRLQGDAAMGPESSWAAITRLRLPHLESVGGELYVYLTGSLVETDFRGLKTVGVRVYYMRNLALRRIGLDSLTSASVSINASPLAASCEIVAICSQVGATDCGSEYSDPDCQCVEQCGRLAPQCAD